MTHTLPWTNIMNQPNEDQLAAILNYRDRHGKHWKESLLTAWLNGTDARQPNGHLLRQVRNQLGPEWLNNFEHNPQQTLEKSMRKTVTVFDVCLDVEFEGTKFVPARVDGPPELCHPCEGGEAEILSIHLEGWEVTELLSERVIQMILEDLTLHLCEDAQAEAEADYADYRYNARRDEALTA